MLKKIKKEHIILIVLVIVVLLLIFINIKNKRGLREGFFNQNINYQIVFSILDEENRILDKIGIIGRNYNNENEEIMLKLFDCKEKEEIINFKGTMEFVDYNMNNMNNMNNKDMNNKDNGIKYNSDNGKESIIISYPTNIANSANYTNPANSTNYQDTVGIDIKYLSKKYELKEKNPQDFEEWEAEDIKSDGSNININKENIITLFNKFYNKNETPYKCIVVEEENCEGIVDKLNPNLDCFIGNSIIENFDTGKYQGNCKEEDRLKSIWEDEFEKLDNFKNSEIYKKLIIDINKDKNFKDHINNTLNSTTYTVQDYFVKDDIDITPIDQQYSGFRSYKNTQGKIIEIDIFNLETGKFKDTKKKFEEMYQDKEEPIWYQLFLEDKKFPLYSSSVLHQNVKKLHDIYLKLLNSTLETQTNYEIEERKPTHEKKYISCGNLNNLNTGVENNENNERFRGNYLVENFNSCSKKDRLESELAKINEDYVIEQNKYWYNKELRTELDTLLQSLMRRNGITDQNEFKKLPNDHKDKIVWHNEQKRVMGEYMRLKKAKMDLENEISITPAPTMEDCPVIPQGQEDNEICPGPSPECSDNTAVAAGAGAGAGAGATTTAAAPVKFRITNFNTQTLRQNIKEKMEKILGSQIKFKYIDNNKYYFTVEINGNNIEHHIQIKEKRENIKNIMTDIYYNHLQDLYISSGKIKEMYNIPKERIRVFVLHGSLKIVLEILSDEYSQGPSDTSIEEQELSDIEEWKQFMSTFNMPGGTENIVQYEPEGVSGIFAPYIKIV
jgi:hypothetical protein